jgi:drug/metabolite transporter (DMT)-like permease
VLGFAGVTAASLMSLSETCDGYSSPLPTVILLVAVVSAAYAWFIIKKLLAKGHSLSKLNGISMFYGGIASFVTWGFYQVSFQASSTVCPVTDVKVFLVSVGLLILLTNIIVYALYGFLLQRYSLTLITFTGFLCPLLTAVLDYLFFKQPICLYDGVALICVAAGLYFFCYARK